MPGKENRQTAVVVEKAYDFLLWLLPKVEKRVARTCSLRSAAFHDRTHKNRGPLRSG
jgi:hypothetical protein